MAHFDYGGTCYYGINPIYTYNSSLPWYFESTDMEYNVYDSGGSVTSTFQVNLYEVFYNNQSSWTISDFGMYECFTALMKQTYIVNFQALGFDASDPARPSWMSSTMNEENIYFNRWPLPSVSYETLAPGLDLNQEASQALALTGPKDVVIVMDCSYSMHDKMPYVKAAAIKAVNALTYADYAQVVCFANTANTHSQGANLLSMTDANKTTLIDYINLVTTEPMGLSDLNQGLSDAFDIIENSMTDGTNTGCYGRGAILLISDFHYTRYSLSSLRGYDRVRHFMVFQFNMDNYKSVNNLACNTDGAAWTMDFPEDLEIYINRYLHYMAEGMYTDAVRWNKTTDPITLAESYVACKPLNVTHSYRYTKIEGATCIDSNSLYSVSDLEGSSDYASAFQTPYLAQTLACPFWVMSESEMNTARTKHGASTCSYLSRSFNYNDTSGYYNVTPINLLDNAIINMTINNDQIDTEYSYISSGYETTTCYVYGCQSPFNYTYYYEELGYASFGTDTTEDYYFQCMANSLKRYWLQWRYYRSTVSTSGFNYTTWSYDSYFPMNNSNSTKFQLISDKGSKLELPNRKDCAYTDERWTEKTVFTYTGPKDIIFYIEDSAYTGQLEYYASTYTYVSKILDQLNDYDRIAAVFVDAAPDSFKGSDGRIVNATATNKANLLYNLSNRGNSTTSPDYVTGLTLVEDIITETHTYYTWNTTNLNWDSTYAPASYNRNCNGVVLMITAGMAAVDLEYILNADSSVTNHLSDFQTYVNNNTYWRISGVSLGACAKNAYYLQKYSCAGEGFYHAADTQANFDLAWQTWYKLFNFGSTNRYFYHTEDSVDKVTMCSAVINNTAVFCQDMSYMVPFADLSAKTNYSDFTTATNSYNNTCVTLGYSSSNPTLSSARGSFASDDCSADLSYTNDSCTLCNNVGDFMNEAESCFTPSGISDCAVYDAASTSGTKLCKSCDSGFLLAADQLSCYTIPTMTGCDGWNVDVCISCSSGYLLNSADECFATSISNCYEYDLATSTVATPVCTECEFYYFLDSNTCTNACVSGEYNLWGTADCVPKNISNCYLYDEHLADTFQRCTVCENGYFLSKENICVPMSLSYCLIYNYANSNFAYPQCFECKYNQTYDLVTDTCGCHQPNTFMNPSLWCVDMNVEFCTAYDTNSAYNIPICTACETNYDLTYKDYMGVDYYYCENYIYFENHSDLMYYTYDPLYVDKFATLRTQIDDFYDKVKYFMLSFLGILAGATLGYIAFSLLYCLCCVAEDPVYEDDYEVQYVYPDELKDSDYNPQDHSSTTKNELYETYDESKVVDENDIDVGLIHQNSNYDKME